MMQFAMLHPLAFILFLSSIFWSLGLGRHIDCQTDRYADTPTLNLPWGTYKGKTTDASGNITVFKNVRFGQAPIGDLRFKASKFPEATKSNAEIQDTTSGPICMQAGLPDQKTGKFPPQKAEETEDCLFLDIYVPSQALKKDADPLPVVVYLYGGAFFYGYKDTTLQLGSQTLNLYDGKGMLDASKNDFIWVVGNYRVGAFGWLAGSTMEADGTPNAGLHDQKLLLEFVNEHIGKVNGDSDSISVWGNSAGAASILHHLTAGESGDDGPKISRAVVWSPAYQWSFDRKGVLDNVFKTFTQKAGCKEATLACLRKADAAALRSANEMIVNESLSTGSFPFGPAVDGSYVRALPGAQFDQGNYKSIESVIVSNVVDEAGLFLPKLSWINSEENFQQFLNTTFPGKEFEEVREAITDEYPVFDDDDKKINQVLRVKRIVRDSVLTCNSRLMLNAYRPAWAMQFNFPPGLHGSDLLPTTWNKDINTGKLVDELLGSYVNETTRRFIESRLAGFSSTYQKYFAGHASYGNPNAFLEDGDSAWGPVFRQQGRIFGVMNVGLNATLQPDFQYRFPADLLFNSQHCSFWENVAAYIGDGTPQTLNSALEEKIYGLRLQPGRQPGRHRSNLVPWEL